METMKAAVLYGDRYLRIADIPKPQVPDNGILGYTQELVDECLALISQGKVDRKPLITHKYALARAADAFEAQIKIAETLKAIIKP